MDEPKQVGFPESGSVRLKGRVLLHVLGISLENRALWLLTGRFQFTQETQPVEGQER